VSGLLLETGVTVEGEGWELVDTISSIKCQDLKFEWRVKSSIPGERVSSFIIYRY
jgi:hypothetical protein